MNKKSEYTILGKVYTAKPLKLQLNKNSLHLLTNLNQYIKNETGLTDDEIKNSDYSVVVSLALMGFVSKEENCAEIFNLLLEGETDWSRLIKKNNNRFKEIKNSVLALMNDFFLNVGMLTGTLVH